MSKPWQRSHNLCYEQISKQHQCELSAISNSWLSSEPVREDQERSEALTSLRSMRRIMPRLRKASALSAGFRKSLGSRGQLQSQEKVRPTTACTILPARGIAARWLGPS